MLRGTAKVADGQPDLWECVDISVTLPQDSHGMSTGDDNGNGNWSSPITHLYALPFLLSSASSSFPSSPSPPAWWKLAACAGYQSTRIMPSDPLADPPVDIFFPERGEKEAVVQAKRICQSCPVRLPCLIDGLRESYGVFGGYTVIEREEIRRQVKSAILILTFTPPHRDQPGWCIDCGMENDTGNACAEPGSRRHDPFFIFERPRREQEEKLAAATRRVEREMEMVD